VRIAAIVVAGTLLAVVAWRVPDLALDHDEVEHLHAAWLVGRGDVPYRDFGENHNPPLWYALAPLVPADESPDAAVLAGRLAMLACSIATLVLAGLLARRLGAGRAAVLAPLLLAASSYWSVYAVAVRPDVPMTTLALLGLLLGLPGPDGRAPSPVRALLAGLALGAATAVLLKAAVVLAVLVAGTLVHAAVRPDERRRRVASALVMAAAAAVPVALLAAALFAAGVLEAAWTWVVRLQGPYLLASGGGFAFAEVAVASVSRDPLPWAGLVLALVAFAAAPSAGRAIGLATVAAVLAGTAATRLPNYQYLFPAVALMAALGADAVAGAGGRPGSRPRARAWGLAGLALLVAVAGARHAVAVATLPDDSAQVARMKAVLAMTAPADTVIAAPPEHPIFRRDALYVWFNNPDFHRSLAALDPAPPCDRYRDDPARLRQRPPAAIVKAGSRWHPFYGVSALANERYEPTADPEILRIVR
jgi:4-amino-4-deoxy-L-arabinose transferase-like glycosyltransferase